MPVKSKSDPSNDILRVLAEKNRPYSVITLTDELHGEYTQTVIKKAVEQLAAENKCASKVSGKAKLYFAKQEGLPVASNEEIEQMDANLEDLREKSRDLKEKLEELRARRNQLSNMKTFEELVEYRKQIEEQVKIEEEKKDNLIKLAEGITPEDAEKSQKEFKDRCTQWRLRKLKCNEIIDQLSEGCQKKPNVLIAEIELETDESEGLKLEFKNKEYIVHENNIE